MRDLYTWDDFKSEWYSQFKKAENALKLVNFYPERLHLVYLGNLLSHQQLENSQRNWVSLCNKLHPADREYFKPYFVPINSDSF